METVAIKAAPREETGRKGMKRVRNEGLIPAVLYGTSEAQSVTVQFNELRHVIYTPDFKLVDLDVDGNTTQCIVKDVQFHPVTEEILHVDFLELAPGRAVKVEVPVTFEGTAAGVRAGGKLVKKMRRIKIMTTPEHMVDELVFDVSELTLGNSIRVKDAQVGEGIEILNSPNIPVASVEIPRALKGADEEEAELEGAEGEEGAATEGGEGGGDAPAEGGE